MGKIKAKIDKSDAKIRILKLKPFSEIVRVYSGEPGCACGCRGRYWPERDYQRGVINTHSKKDFLMFKRVYKLFEANLSSVYSWEKTKDQFVALDMGSKRTYTIYYRIPNEGLILWKRCIV